MRKLNTPANGSRPKDFLLHQAGVPKLALANTALATLGENISAVLTQVAQGLPEVEETPPAPPTPSNLFSSLQVELSPGQPKLSEGQGALPTDDGRVSTRDVIDDLLRRKRHKKLRESTVDTYLRDWNDFDERFPFLPRELPPVLDYLDTFDGETGRHRLNKQANIGMLYRHAERHFGVPNILAGLERPEVRKRPPRSLSLSQARALVGAPQRLEERVALEFCLGHGWRQVEVRRVLKEDVEAIQDSLILCHGKEREEPTPILAETAQGLRALAAKVAGGPVFLGRRGPLGEDGMAQLLGRLFDRAGLDGFTGHDLRRTFGTLVRKASGDEFLAIRLLRDKVPGMSDRYLAVDLEELKAALERYSPLRQIKEGPRPQGRGPISLVETGESRTLPEYISGGAGGRIAERHLCSGHRGLIELSCFGSQLFIPRIAELSQRV